MIDLLLVLTRVITGTSANVLQKQLGRRSADELAIVFLTYLQLVILFVLPFGLSYWLEPIPWEYFSAAMLAGFIDGVGNLFLIQSLVGIPLSVFGPLNALKSVISAGFAWALLSEVPSTQGFIGMLLIVAGAGLLSQRANEDGGSARLFQRNALYRVLSLILFALGTIPLKQSVQGQHYLQVSFLWSIVGALTIFLIGAILRRPVASGARYLLSANFKQTAALAILIAFMQLSTLILFQRMLLGYALAFIQFGTLLHVVAGRVIFQEGDFVRRFCAALIMAVGAALIVYCG